MSTGTIIEGQGTLSIKALVSEREFNEAAGGSFVVTLTSKIPSAGSKCDQIASETLPVEGPRNAILLDEFSVPLAQIDKRRLAEAAAVHRKNPNNQLHIIEYFPSGTSDFDIRQKLRAIQEFLETEANLPEGYVTVVSTFADESNTKIYRIPPGGQTPKP